MLFKLSNLNSNLAPTLGYINPALNNLAQGEKGFFFQFYSINVHLLFICPFIYLYIFSFTHSFLDV